MKNLLFLTNMYPEETADFYDSQGFSAGGNNITYIQKSLLEGFDALDGVDCTVINKMLIRHQKKCRVPQKRWSHTKGGEERDVSFSYINKPLFSSNLLFAYAKKNIKEWLSRTEGERMVIAYGLTNYNLSALAYIKKKDPNSVTAIIVPDLPEHTKKKGKNLVLNMKNRIANYITDRKIQKQGRFIDRYFLFAEAMKEKLNCSDRFMVFEGLATDTFAQVVPYKWENGERVLIYGGGLHAKYGLDLLLDAFALLEEPEYRLVLCGNGDFVPEIKRRAEKDHRIMYLGTIPREELLRYQAGASVLINPRTNEQIFSKYSFPSKNMEYLSSGVPMIGFKLGGIPDEYDSYIAYPEAEKFPALAEKIREICTYGVDKAALRAFAAKEFVLTEKNKFSQAKKMLDFMMLNLEQGDLK